MKMYQMTIAQVQYHMSKSSNRFYCSNWSVNDEIDHHNNRAVPCTPSRNQREGYFDGKSRGTYKFTRVKYKINRVKIS